MLKTFCFLKLSALNLSDLAEERLEKPKLKTVKKKFQKI